jgi:hypothetical protein
MALLIRTFDSQTPNPDSRLTPYALRALRDEREREGCVGGDKKPITSRKERAFKKASFFWPLFFLKEKWQIVFIK